MQQLAARSHAAHASPRLNRRARALRSAAGSSGGSNSTDSAASSSCAGDAPRFTPWPQGGLVHVDAEVSPGAEVHAGAVVLAGARVGEGAVVGANSVVGEGVRVGRGTVLRFGVALSHCNVGAGCVLHHGVAVGADGFGFDVDPATGRVLKKPQELRVLIGDEVEIGANSCVDRGSWRDTVVGDQCKLDNMVQVGHNALLGTGCLLCGHVALGGSSELGDYVVMGGKSAVKDHVKVASGVRVAAKSGVIQDVTERGDVGGYPAVSAREWRRREAILRRLSKQSKRRTAQNEPLPVEQ